MQSVIALGAIAEHFDSKFHFVQKERMSASSAKRGGGKSECFPSTRFNAFSGLRQISSTHAAVKLQVTSDKFQVDSEFPGYLSQAVSGLRQCCPNIAVCRWIDKPAIQLCLKGTRYIAIFEGSLDIG